MKRSFLSPPDPYTRAPLIALLPVCGEISRLEALTSSLYARFERVKALHSESPDAQGRKINLELGMLTQVLDWLSVQPGNESPSRGGDL